MNHQRRQVLKSAGAAGVVGVAVAAGLLKPTAVYAQSWNAAGFEARDLAGALKSIKAEGAAESAQITVKAPDIAENGAVVPVEVTSNLPGTESIAIVADKNNFPLIAQFDLMNGAEGFVSTRIKLGSTSQVRAYVRAGGKMHTASKEVKVTIGGCGG